MMKGNKHIIKDGKWMSWARKALALLTTSLCSMHMAAQEQQTEPLMPGEKPKPSKYIAIEEQKQHLVFFQGFTLAVDLFGPVSYAISDYGAAEAALRLNLKNTFFPIVEAGYGKCEKEDYNTSVSYKAKAPYGRIGLDVNLLKDKFQDNRLYIGARYGLSVFKYDIAGPAMTDPIWGGSQSFDFRGIDCTSQWIEAVFGAEVKIYKNFHMGWAVRFKRELSSTKSDCAKPSCIPGYGYTTNATCWGGTYTLIFDLNWGKKRSHKRGYNVELRDIPSINQQEEMAPSEKGTIDGVNEGSEEATTEIEKEATETNEEENGGTE